MKFPRNVVFKSSDIEIEEIQIEPEFVEEIPDEPEIITFELTEDELNEKLNDAFNKGVEQGKEDVKEALSEQFNEKGNQFSDLISNIVSSEEQFFHEIENYIIKIATKISENIIQTEIESDPTKIIKLVTNAVDRLKESRTISIFLSEDDFLLIEEIDLHDRLKLSSNIDVKLMPKDSLKNGSFYIESDMGNLYSTIKDQLEDMTRRLT